ncbi:STE3-domain-containing protein [Serendipita vermifera]|nr:STE3-domain-containing protein [Serendipita vermifera]
MPRVPVGLSDLYPAQQVLYALSLAAILFPAPSLFRKRNTGILLLMSWLFASQLCLLVNSIVWRGNIKDVAPFWCDFSTAILAIIGTAIACSTLVINRQLYRKTKVDTVQGDNQAEKRKQLLIDLGIGLGLPILDAGGHAIIQGHRYDIYEDVGCFPTIYNVTLAYPLYYIWPSVISIISAIYGGIALYRFIKLNKSVSTLLSSKSSDLNKNKYIRLMCLCCIDLIFSIPYHLYVVIDNATNRPVDPWVSWEVTQFDWYRVDFYRRVIIDMSSYIRTSMILIMVSTSTICLIFFLLFGLTQEVFNTYKDMFYFCLKPFGVKRPTPIPSYNRPPPKRTWLDKLLGREAKAPSNSVSNTTGSIPVFASIPHQEKSFPSARPKNTMTSTTDTLNWEDDVTDDGSNVMVVGHRLTIPGLNALTSLDTLQYDEKDGKAAKGRPYTPTSPTTSQTSSSSSPYAHTRLSHSPV